MTGTLVFGKDDTLWLKVDHPMATDGEAMVALHKWSEGAEPLLSRMWNTFELEAGVTLLDLLKCLLPWEDVVGPLAQMDIAAWIAALERGLETPCEEATQYLGIVLQRRMEISAEPDFLIEKPSSEDETPDERGFRTFESIFGKSTPVITDRLEIDDSWDALLLANPAHDWEGQGYDPLAEGQTERVFSTSFCEPALLARLPIIIRETADFQDTTWESSYLSASNGVGILNGENGMVERSGRLMSTKFASNFNVGNTLLRGLLWDIGFHGTPADTAERGSEIKASIDDVNSYVEGLEEGAEGDDDAEAGEDALESSGPMKVVLAPSMMESLSSRSIREDEDTVDEKGAARDGRILMALLDNPAYVRGIDEDTANKMALRLDRYVRTNIQPDE